MKKIFIILVAVFAFTTACFADTQSLRDNIAIIRGAIKSYKAQNYTQCIVTLTEYVKTHPISAAAFYYLGNSYMKIGVADKARENYERTVDINTVPQLTSYALQAIDCIDRGPGVVCEYYSFNRKQIAELQENPTMYLENVRNNLLSENVREGADEEIEKLIQAQGIYEDRIHPEAKQVLSDEKFKRERYNMNKRSMLPVSNKIAKAIKVSYPVHSYAPNAVPTTTEITPDEMELIIMSETAALQK